MKKKLPLACRLFGHKARQYPHCYVQHGLHSQYGYTDFAYLHTTCERCDTDFDMGLVDLKVRDCRFVAEKKEIAAAQAAKLEQS